MTTDNVDVPSDAGLVIEAGFVELMSKDLVVVVVAVTIAFVVDVVVVIGGVVVVVVVVVVVERPV